VASALRTLTLDRDITGAMTSPRSFSADYQYGRRLEREQTFGYHGDGSAAGKTIYASLQFSGETVALPYTDNLVAVGPATGAWTYGRASLEFKPSVAARTTIAPADMVLQARPEQVGGVEQLRSVTMERLANDRELMAQIDLVDDATATRTLSAYLRSGDMAPYDVKLAGYMEAQVRGGATTSDLRRVIVNPRAVAGSEVPLRDQRAIADGCLEARHRDQVRARYRGHHQPARRRLVEEFPGRHTQGGREACAAGNPRQWGRRSLMKR